MASWRCSCNCWWTLFFWQSKMKKNRRGLRGKKRSVSLSTRNRLGTVIVFEKTQRQAEWDSEWRTRLLTIHFGRIKKKMSGVCTFAKSFHNILLLCFLLYIWEVSSTCFFSCFRHPLIKKPPALLSNIAWSTQLSDKILVCCNIYTIQHCLLPGP